MKEKLITFLEIQDSSKSPFQFLFKGKRNIYFPFGMFLSLLINISTICLSTILLLELIYHSKPNVSFAKFQSQLTKNMTLNTKELIFTITFRDKNHNLINDPSIAFIKANYLKTIAKNGIINSYVFNLTSMNCSNIYPILDLMIDLIQLVFFIIIVIILVNLLLLVENMEQIFMEILNFI